jgi:hypothetical protein
MTLEDILGALLPLLHEDETATITKSDDFGDRMIAVEGTTRKTNIYDYDGMYVWYSQPGGGSWPTGDANAMNEQLATMLDYARTSPLSGDLRAQEAREMTPADLLEQLADLLAGGAPAITGTLPDGTEIAEIDYGPGAIHIEKGRNADFSAWAITHSHRWPASRRDLSQARGAITDILAAVKPTN